jgi:hypothetical protein
LFFIIVFLGYYIAWFYPVISPGLGGGLPLKSKLIGDKDSIEILQTLVTMEDKYRTTTLDLLDQTDSAYIVLAEYTDNNVKQPVFVHKDLVKGVMLIQDEKYSVTVPVTSTALLTPTVTVTSTVRFFRISRGHH